MGRIRAIAALVLLLVAPVAALAWGAMAIGGGVTAVVPGGCDSCTGTLLFSSHFEALDVTSGTPCGCSVGDTTGTASSAAVINSDLYSDGANSLDCPTSTDYLSYSISSGDIFSQTAGTITFRLYITTFKNGAILFRNYIDADNRFQISLSGTDDATGRECTILWRGNATSVSAATTAANMAVNTWYTVTGKYQSTGNPNLSIQIDATTAATSNTDPTAFVGTPATVVIGEAGGITGSDFHVDDLKITNAY